MNTPTSPTLPTSPAASRLLADLQVGVAAALGPEAATLQIDRAVLGIFFTGVRLSNGAGGLCATPIKSVPQAVCCPSSAAAMPIPGRLRGRGALALLDDLFRPQDLRRALAIATLNALVETLWRRHGPPLGVDVFDGDAFDALALPPGRRVALVGAFPPYMRELRRRGQPFTVLELDPSTLRPEELPYFAPAHEAERVVPAADVLITTGTTLINDTLDGLLALLRPGAQAAIVGPTATLWPQPYLSRGATLIGGTRVVDADALLDLLAEGGSGHHLFGRSVQRVCLRVRPG